MSTLPIPKQVLFDVFIFLIVCLPLVLFQALGKPVATGFWCYDPSLSYPYKPDTVPQSLLLTISLGVPFLVMAVTESIRAAIGSRISLNFRAEMMSLIKAYGIFLFGMTCNCIFTDALKFSVGRLRPHFFDVCKPDFDKLNCTADIGIDRFITDYICTNTHVEQKWIQDSQLSFPSGHASVAIYSATFTVFYQQIRMHVSFSNLLRPVLQMCAVLVALYCCITRVTDNKHFPSDVIAGSAIGFSLAWAVFYHVAYKIIPSTPADKPPRLPRTTSIESEPQTPTPLIRPDRIVIDHNYKNSTSIPCSKDNFVHKV